MVETRYYPEVITPSLPNLDMQGESRFENYDFANITHIVVHPSDTMMKNINAGAKANTSYNYDNKDYLKIMGKILSVKFFGNDYQLEWLDSQGVGRHTFIAFTNTEKKWERVQNQTPSDEKLEVVEVMFMPTNPREVRKAFWRPARDFVFGRVQARVKESSLEMIRLRVMWTRLTVSPRKLQKLRKGSASPESACLDI
ncbi:hypothetical protein PENCOP_c001G08156 [Penicillium coprophilum]|uniref:Uncharacterized protein n=1 Tax=Penicillium coprophilum TaxID=36646 RepID=A0A1V6V9J3_9EURO|nr:hypothetical protein PENCOP_c001G08156 [Penicillium coprophilum]